MTLCCARSERHENNDFKEDKSIVDLMERVIEEGRNLNVSSRVIAETIIQRLLKRAKKEI